MCLTLAVIVLCNKFILLYFLKWYAEEEAIVLAPLDIPKSVSGHINHHYESSQAYLKTLWINIANFVDHLINLTQPHS